MAAPRLYTAQPTTPTNTTNFTATSVGYSTGQLVFVAIVVPAGVTITLPSSDWILFNSAAGTQHVLYVYQAFWKSDLAWGFTASTTTSGCVTAWVLLEAPCQYMDPATDSWSKVNNTASTTITGPVSTEYGGDLYLYFMASSVAQAITSAAPLTQFWGASTNATAGCSVLVGHIKALLTYDTPTRTATQGTAARSLVVGVRVRMPTTGVATSSMVYSGVALGSVSSFNIVSPYTLPTNDLWVAAIGYTTSATINTYPGNLGTSGTQGSARLSLYYGYAAGTGTTIGTVQLSAASQVVYALASFDVGTFEATGSNLFQSCSISLHANPVSTVTTYWNYNVGDDSQGAVCFAYFYGQSSNTVTLDATYGNNAQEIGRVTNSTLSMYGNQMTNMNFSSAPYNPCMTVHPANTNCVGLSAHFIVASKRTRKTALFMSS